MKGQRKELRLIPIVIVTSLALSDGKAKARSAGCNDYMTKP